ncbi:hypothetical protein FPOA_06804 [Fusarium poae]|uniref:Uncharacterized protein n=1 Tax=Fusarium poae TaxID=36050 RepID=A0A1B8AJE9_FUSPO|nr:hypothetical protein FPOA_06804 [Fusarium poae]
MSEEAFIEDESTAFHTNAMIDDPKTEDGPTGEPESRGTSPAREADVIEELKWRTNDDDDYDSIRLPHYIYDAVVIHGISSQSSKRCDLDTITPFIRDTLKGVAEEQGRIITWGYYRNVEEGRYYTPDGVYKEAEDMLDYLCDLRTSEIKEMRRPIYFFSHDIGGTIVKAIQALSLASKHGTQYSEIFECTRAMYFFGYPHRCPNPGILEDAILRIMAQESLGWPGGMLNYARSLRDTILDVNDSFLQTQILTQANFINVVSTHQDPVQQIFPFSMSTMGTPFERVVKMESPHSDLILAGSDGSHPVNDIADLDWLTGGLTDKQHVAFRKLVNQASPVFPYRKIDTSWQHPDLLELPKVNKNYIIHMRCSHGADELSENASFFLDNHRKGIFQPLLFMKFDANDVRFNNCEAMLRSFLARFTSNRLQSGDFVARTSRGMTDIKFRNVIDLFNRWEVLLNNSDSFGDGIHVLGCFDNCDDSAIWFLTQVRKLFLRSEVGLKMLIITTKGSPGDSHITSTLSEFPTENVKSIEYIPADPPPFPVDVETSKFMQRYSSLVGIDQRSQLRTMLSPYANDHQLCELVLQWLSSDKEQIKRIPTLSEKSLTPAILFLEILDSIPVSERAWAKIVISWLLASYRPLRSEELLRVSDLAWTRTHGNNFMPPGLHDIQKRLRGILTIENGEVHFRHSDMRYWLGSQQTAFNEKMWYYTTELGRHNTILHTCIDHLNDMTRNTKGWAHSLPYAIEFWSQHSESADASEDLLLSLFENEPVFQRWANALVEIPNRRLNPLPEHINPLYIASHLGLTTLVKKLLEGHSYEATLLNQALIEACRVGHASLIRLFLDSKLFDLNLSNYVMHEAAKAVSGVGDGNDEALRELINSLPMPLDSHNVQMSRTDRRDDNYEAKENQPTDNSMDNSSFELQAAGDETQNDGYESDPLEWLTMPMYRAAGSGMEDVVAKLLQLGLKPNPSKGITPHSMSYLHSAVGDSRYGCTKLLIDAGASLTYQNDSGKSVFEHAIAWSSGEVIQLLLDSGARVDEIQTCGDMPLGSAMFLGSFEATKVILSYRDYHEYFFHDPDKHPVNAATENGNQRCLELVLDQGFSPNNVTSSGETALRTAIEKGRFDLCELLLQHGADPDLTPEGTRTPLIQAIFEGDLGMVKLLVEHKAAIDKREMPPDAGWSRTPMHIAVDWKKPTIVEYLLQQGADPNARDSDGVPVIMAAADSGDADVVQWLLDKGSVTNLTSYSDERTALQEAVPHPEVVRVLLQHGADITTSNSESRTPLDFAISSNYLESVQIILEKCRDVLDLDSETIRQELCLAVVNGFTDVVGALLEAGADVNTVNEDGESLLMLAVKHNAESDMVCKILEYNPNVAIRDNKQNTALHQIKDFTVLETVRRIVNSGAKLDVVNDSEETPLVLAIRAQLDDVFSYMLRKQPTLVHRGLASSNTILTPLHEACIKGSLFMVQSLINYKVEVNSCCEWLYGTPLVAATLRWSTASHTGLASDIMAPTQEFRAVYSDIHLSQHVWDVLQT